MPLSKSGLIIAGIGAVLIAAVIVGRNNGPPGPAGSPARRGGSPATAAATMPVADVKLEALQQRHAEQREAERNLFRFEARSSPALPGRPEAVATPSTSAPAPAISLPAGPPPPPPIPFRFIGLVDAPSQAGRVAILSDGRGNVFYGKDGDIIEGRYKVLKVGTDTAELSYLDGRGRQTIRLTGQ